MPPEDSEQLEIEYPDEEPDYLYESDFYEVENEGAGIAWYTDPIDIDWDYGDDTEDEEFLSE